MAGLRTLDAAAATQVGAVSVQVLWRCLQLMGLAPDLESCAGCGRGVAAEEELHLALNGEGRCRHCATGYGAGSVPAGLRLDPAARRFLVTTAGLPLARALRLPFPGAERLRRVLQQMIQNGLEAPLNSLRCAAGIL